MDNLHGYLLGTFIFGRAIFTLSATPRKAQCFLSSSVDLLVFLELKHPLELGPFLLNLMMH